MKIGFIAMSGLRLCDVELLNLGLTFPGVSRRKNAIEALPSLGLLTLAGMTPPHITVEYLKLRDVDLDQSPVPRFELLAPDRYPRFTVQTQRGCPWRCEFCAASIRISPQFKVKPVDRVIAEIRRLKELWRDPFVEFADDNTFVNRAHSKQLMRALARENIRWFTETDLSIAQDPEL